MRINERLSSEQIASAWQRLAVLRRRWLYCMGGMLAGCALLLPVAILLPEDRRPLVIPFLGIIFLPAWAIGLATGLQMMGFRCPHCGKRFCVTTMSNWPWRRRCPHCGAPAIAR